MKKSDLTQLQTWGILGGAAIMLSLAMGMRQSFGLLQPHMIRDIGITAADFSMAVALQNIVWGATQPVVGNEHHGSNCESPQKGRRNGRSVGHRLFRLDHCFAHGAVPH